MYSTIDEFHFIELLKNIIPKVIIFEIFQYTYTTCIDCNKYLLKECVCSCNRVRCEYHNFMNTFEIQHKKIGCFNCSETGIRHYTFKNLIKCTVIDCEKCAWYGYKDCVLFCNEHRKNKYKIIEYDICCYDDCWLITNKICVNTRHVHCFKHMIPNDEYEYNYVKKLIIPTLIKLL